MSLPTYNPSVITAVSKVKQNAAFSQFIMGGNGGVSHSEYALFKKTTTYGNVISMWRSPVYQIGKPFDVLEIKFVLKGGVTNNKHITPTLYFDNSSSSSEGNSISTGTYVSSEKLIKLNAKSFSNVVHGTNNFFFELQFDGIALAVVKLPIEIIIDVHDI